MFMKIANDRVCFGIQVPFVRFAALAAGHASANPDTPLIEAHGKELLVVNFSESNLEFFVRAVCAWGGYPGISGRILSRNTSGELRAAFQEASSHMTGDAPNVSAALASLNRLSGLGTPSFASKHLRFLFPQHCPVFDSLLREALPYSFDPKGYGSFAQDCSVLASELSRRAVANPWPGRNGVWFAADAEAALYAYFAELDTDEG